MSVSAHQWLNKIRTLDLPDKVRIMNVCGGHERAITMAGLRGVLPSTIELIPGPGCPVCICPEEDIYQAMQLAKREQITLLAFGDMLRVPVNLPKREIRSLAQARATGADIRPIASPSEAVQIASNNPGKEVVFFAAGFETTTAPVAAMLAEGVPANLSVLLSGRLTWPAVAMLLDSEQTGFDALIAPGHVSAVMGPEEWEFVVRDHNIPAAVAGFTAESLLAAIHYTLRQLLENNLFLDNCYPEVIRPGGNSTAQRYLQQTLDVVDSNWRGIGIIPASGYQLKESLGRHNARKRFPCYADLARSHIGEMPQGCDCARVVLGKIYPNSCKLYGTTCTPRNPVGPCMVSDEGACRIWWAGGVREPEQTNSQQII